MSYLRQKYPDIIVHKLCFHTILYKKVSFLDLRPAVFVFCRDFENRRVI